MIRTVVVTTVKDRTTGARKELYGRYDAVAVYNQGYEIVATEKQQYEMSDADFVANATFKQIVRSNIKED